MYTKKELAKIMSALVDKSISVKHMIDSKQFTCNEELESLKNESIFIDEITNKTAQLIDL